MSRRGRPRLYGRDDRRVTISVPAVVHAELRALARGNDLTIGQVLRMVLIPIVELECQQAGIAS